jgi:hypothetical protein
LEFEINTKCRRREYNFELQMKERGEGKNNNIEGEERRKKYRRMREFGILSLY